MAKRAAAGIAHNPHELRIIAGADRYAVYLRLGRLKKCRIEFATADQARAAAQQLADQHRRSALVYAIAGEAAAVLCTVQPRGA